MDSEVLAALAGGFIGGILGVVGTLLSSYYGPKRLEEWRAERQEERINGPRKALLKQMLDNPKFTEGRSLETLSKVTGTSHEECRRLLIELGARGFTLKDKREGWVYISKRPLNEI